MSTSTSVNEDILRGMMLINNFTEPLYSEAHNKSELDIPSKTRNFDLGYFRNAKYETEQGEPVIETKDYFIPLCTIGNVNSNAPFARVLLNADISSRGKSAGVVRPREMCVVCRPLNLESAVELSTGYDKGLLRCATTSVSTVCKLMTSKSSNIYSNSYNVNNLLAIINAVSSNEVDATTGAKLPMVKIIKRPYSVRWTAEKEYMKNPFHNQKQTMSMIQAVTKTYYSLPKSERPNTISFYGFSLGADMANVLSLYTRMSIEDPNVRVKLFSAASPPSGNKMFVKNLQEKMHSITSVMIDKDPVNRVNDLNILPQYKFSFKACAPRNAGLMNVEGYRLTKNNRLTDNKQPKVGLWKLIMNYVQGKTDDFKMYHLSAEDLIPRFLIDKEVTRVGKFPATMKSFATLSITKKADVICSWYQNSSASLKCSLCPPSICMMALQKTKKGAVRKSCLRKLRTSNVVAWT